MPRQTTGGARRPQPSGGCGRRPGRGESRSWSSSTRSIGERGGGWPPRRTGTRSWRGRGRRFRPDRFDGGALEEALLGGGAPLPPDDPLVAFAAGSARTGEGVRAAFEWAVLAARDAQRERRRSGAGA